MDRAKKFREAAARENRGRRRTGWRYSAELRSLAAGYCRRERQAGRPLTEIAGELGISTLTLNRWLEAPSGAGFRQVAVVADLAVSEGGDTPSLTAVTPGGLRLEGLSWPQVLELARAFR